MYTLYTILILLSLPFVLLRLLLKSRLNVKYRHHIAERLGVIPFQLESCIWVHAVSVGEVMTARLLIDKLLVSYPNTPILLTVTTPTGRDRAQSIFSDRVSVCYLPYDLSFLLRQLIKKVHPKLLIIMETELWPGLLVTCKKNNIPTILVNGRLSAHSAKKYAYFKRTTKLIFDNLDRVAARNNKDEKRFLALGLPASKIEVTGNMKFDLTIVDKVNSIAKMIKSQCQDRAIWIAASTHDGEEKYILTVHKQLLKKHPGLLLIIVPRHQERFNKVYNLCVSSHLETQRISSLNVISSTTEVLLGDRMGQLLDFFRASDVAFMGGSLVATGGHNVLEPAAVGVPVVIGPYTFNFPEIMRLLLKEDAIIQVQSVSALTDEISELLLNAQARREIVKRAKQIIARNQGALAKLMKLIGRLLAP